MSEKRRQKKKDRAAWFEESGGLNVPAEQKIRDLQRENERLTKQVRQLDGDLYTAQKYNTFNSKGAQLGVDFVIAEARQEREDYEARIAELEQQVNEQQNIMNSWIDQYIPAWVVTGRSPFQLPNETIPKDTYFQNTLVGLTAWFRYGPEKDQMEHATLESIFPGKLKDATSVVLKAMLTAMKRIPVEDDVGIQELDGISKSEFLNICWQLAPYRYVLKNEFNDKRSDAFERIWPQIEAEIKTKDITKTKKRRDVFKLFKLQIDRTFEAADKRRS